MWDAAEGAHLFPQYSKMKLRQAGQKQEAELEIKKLPIVFFLTTGESENGLSYQPRGLPYLCSSGNSEPQKIPEYTFKVNEDAEMFLLS